MLNLILKLKLLLKMFNFTKDNHLIITYKGSKIVLTSEGDIIINAKRNLVHNYKLLFQDCNDEFIDYMTQANKDNNLNKALEEQIDKEVIKEATNVRLKSM